LPVFTAGTALFAFGGKERPMTLQELHQTFVSRAKGLAGFIYLKTNGDEDLKQESLEAMWRGLQKDSSATDAYLRTRMRWRTRDVWKKGSSIDTHPVSRAQARVCLLNDSDAEDEVMTECIRDRHFPLDEQVINKVDSERFLNTLDMTERAIVLNKLKGMTDKEVIKDLGMTRERYGYVRDAIRPKIEDYFTSA
jgi:DNA-directed RNA polymerase specialized sigma24 family protein